MGRRARRRASAPAGPEPRSEARDARAPSPAAPPPPAGTEAAEGRAPSRSEARNAAARAGLEPLREGERPRAVTVGAIVAALSGMSNAGLWLAGVEINGERPPVFALVFSALLVVTAWGMWRARYWAVLAFEALLGITLVTVAVPVVVGASPVQALIFTAVVLIPGALLFWFLVKAMARVQMPRRR